METFYYLEKALLSLTKQEHKRFEKFLHADYFKKKHSRFHEVFIFYKLIKIKILRPRNKRFTVSELNKIIKDIYTNKKNDAVFCKKYLTLLKSDLLSYLLDFIVIDRIKKNSLEYMFAYLKELNIRGLNDIFEHHCTINQIKEIYAINNETEKAYYFYKLQNLVNDHKEKNNIPLDDGDYKTEHRLLMEYMMNEDDRLCRKIKNKK